NGSLTKAASELRVTQGAVSRHVTQLEQWLGLSLCRRLRRGIETTTEGALYAAMLSQLFDELDIKTRRLKTQPTGTTLRIKLPPTFAIRWMVPRLARFHALNRHIDVQITTSHQPVDFDREDIDVCIHSGLAPPANTISRRLFGETLLPVCSPGLFRDQALPKRPADLSRFVLLCSMHRPNDWPDWLRAAKLKTINGNNGLKFAQQAFVEEDLRSGRLVAPFKLAVPTPNSYFLVYPESKASSPFVKAFADWIALEAIPKSG
ncbi:MAG: LysR family transcriptional regulator, partial [Rhizobiales bacterium]|nr:LysR family transcriptional regulator [Hyphomicrobiales bacterium]